MMHVWMTGGPMTSGQPALNEVEAARSPCARPDQQDRLRGGSSNPFGAAPSAGAGSLSPRGIRVVAKSGARQYPA